jgi:2,3-bisphosphoglycerate-independent phosphoglycerate mutase
MTSWTRPYRPAVLVVLDGWGQAPPGSGCPGANAILAAFTPHMVRLLADYPNTLLGASGEAVGLKRGQMGDSNVGHLNLGAGRIVYQDLVRIDRAVADGSLLFCPAVARLCLGVAERQGVLHLMGLLSDGGVHSHIGHLAALLAAAERHAVGRLRVHAFLDGRDVPPRSAAAYLERLDGLLSPYRETGRDWRLATIAGRYFAMDRDQRWDRTAMAFAAIAGPGDAGAATFAGWRAALEAAYEAGESDEFLCPQRLDGAMAAQPAVDGFLFWNFRADRARQLTRAFVEPPGQFAAFPRPAGWPAPADRFLTMARYDDRLACPVIFEPQDLAHTLGEVVAAAGGRQLRLAETEKYAHVTFFFSGGRETPFPGEDRILVPSPRVATYDLCPEMSAPAITAAAVEAIRSGKYDLIVMNYANGDMVGHTGDFVAAKAGVEAVDRGLGEVVASALAAGGVVLVTADHGNAEQMRDCEHGGPHTAHTANPVPAALAAAGLPAGATLRAGILADVAPTLLQLMGLPQPPAMTGRTLLAGAGFCRVNED